MLRDLYEARRRRRIREEIGNLVISASIAAMAGATLGILFAPKSGKETRAEIAESTKGMAANVKSSAKDIADEVYVKSLEAKKVAKDTVEKIAAKTEQVIADVTGGKEECVDCEDCEEVEEIIEEEIED